MLIMCAAKIEKMFVQRHTDHGWVFYVFEQKMSSIDKRQFPKEIAYDYTYVEESDSVSMLSTVVLNSPAKPVRVKISAEKSEYAFIPEQVFVNTKGNKMVYRLKIEIPFSFWEKMYFSQMPFKVSYDFMGGETISTYAFAEKPAKWNSVSNKMKSIIGIIKLNVDKK